MHQEPEDSDQPLRLLIDELHNCFNELGGSARYPRHGKGTVHDLDYPSPGDGMDASALLQPEVPNRHRHGEMLHQSTNREEGSGQPSDGASVPLWPRPKTSRVTSPGYHTATMTSAS